ncbi:MAG: glycerophosphodiester phosphodiesterase [Abitibacteriaceae bacterium]|nr:glycerophosphodiester phosphodiesterase [Abditibacteriaceae bacterium]MBV9867048.1 glycerophosphodiester phosphodiesterase [Abditibacteriaceae bacterium]
MRDERKPAENDLVNLSSLIPHPSSPHLSMEIWAHRGASDEAPENTLASIERGWPQADGVEIDVHLSRDGAIVVLHDDNTKRVAGVDKKVAEQTLAELRQLDAGRWKQESFAGESIPTLDEVVATMPPQKRLIIEIKCGPEIIPALQRPMGDAARSGQQCCFIAFSHPTLQAIKQAFPAVPAYWLSSFRAAQDSGAWEPTIETLIAQAKAAEFDGLDLHYDGPLEARTVTQIQEAGLQCYVWTVNDPVVAQRLVAAGVDGITTDRPAWLRLQLMEA